MMSKTFSLRGVAAFLSLTLEPKGFEFRVFKNPEF